MGLRILFPVKALPHPEGLKSLAGFVDGFDISNAQEWALLPRRERNNLIVSCSSPLVTDLTTLTANKTLYMSAQSLLQLKNCRRHPGLMLRLNPYDLQKGNLRRSSRFGFGQSDLSKVPEDIWKQSNLQGVSTHFGFNIETGDMPIAYLMELKKICEHHCWTPKIVNLGGGWLKTTENQMSFVVGCAQKLFPHSELWIETGAALTRGAVSLNAKVVDWTESKNEFFLHLNTSFECHMRWSVPQVRGLRIVEAKKRKQALLWLCGSTCSETDRLGPFAMEPGRSVRDYAGQTFHFEDLLGYSISWNHSFNGVPQLAVRFKK